MAPFLVDPVSTFILPTKRKIKTSYMTHHKNSGGDAMIGVAIVGGLFGILIIFAIVACLLKRRKSKGKGVSSDGGLTRGATFSGYSADTGPGLLGGTPGAYAGGPTTGQQGGGLHNNMSGSGYKSDDDDSASDYSTSSGGGRFPGGEAAGGRGRGEAASYYYPPQGHGGRKSSSQNPYKMGGYGAPQRPPMAYVPSPTHASFV